MKKAILILVVILCTAFINTTGQPNDTIAKAEAPIIVQGSDLKKDSLNMELNRVKAEKEKAFQELIIELSNDKKLR